MSAATNTVWNLVQGLNHLWSGVKGMLPDTATVLNAFCQKHGAHGVWHATLFFALAFALPALLEWWLRKKTGGLLQAMRQTVLDSDTPRFRYWLFWSGLKLGYWACFSGVSLFALALIFQDSPDFWQAGFAIWKVVTAYRLAVCLARVIFIGYKNSGGSDRFLPLATARWLCRWFPMILLVSMPIAQLADLLLAWGLPGHTYIAWYSLAVWPSLLATIILAKIHKDEIAEDILLGPDKSDPTQIRRHFADHWVFYAFFYTASITLLWQWHLLITGQDKVLTYYLSLFSIPLFWSLDRLGYWLCKKAFLNKQESVLELPTHSRKFLSVLHLCLRLILVSILTTLLIKIWALYPEEHTGIVHSALSIGVTVLVFYLAWSGLRFLLLQRTGERGLGKHNDDDMEMGEGGDRKQTLLAITGKFVFIFVSGITVLIVLSQMGVDITPLLAGAGVLGLAVGFGSQSLVKDIISGIFYLIDDAFRIGDYVDTGKVRGTVENISIRSVRLRHHRGMVHTIPFSDLGLVTNYSRDWIVTKLKVRVPFDTDIKLIKKIVKKINKEIHDNPELSHQLLADIKSQGVKKLDDSALVIRVKFMTAPGGQFLVKREVYRQLQKHFKKNGLEFASRKVTVRVESDNQDASQEAIAGGAALLVGEEINKTK